MGSSIVLNVLCFHSKLSLLHLEVLSKGVQNNNANHTSMSPSLAFVDNPKFVIHLVIYYAHLLGRSAVGSQPFCKSNKISQSCSTAKIHIHASTSEEREHFLWPGVYENVEAGIAPV